MAYFSKKTKQRIIDDYLQPRQARTCLSRRSSLIGWLIILIMKPTRLSGRDDELLNEAKLDLARRFASGLRIVAKTEVIESEVRRIKVTEYPAYISPVTTRRQGGGYEPFDPESEESQAELRRQAGVQLAAWLNRYRGAAEHIGLDMTPIEEMAMILRDEKEEDAA